MKVKIKKLHKDAVIPFYSKTGDAGMDLTAISIDIKEEYGFLEYGTGISFEMPSNYVGLIFPRSSISKTSLTLCNAVGVIDSSYRGEIKLRFNLSTVGLVQQLVDNKLINIDENDSLNTIYKINERVGQLIILPYPQIEFEEVDELDETDRGSGGYGSTGK